MEEEDAEVIVTVQDCGGGGEDVDGGIVCTDTDLDTLLLCNAAGERKSRSSSFCGDGGGGTSAPAAAATSGFVRHASKRKSLPMVRNRFYVRDFLAQEAAGSIMNRRGIMLRKKS